MIARVNWRDDAACRYADPDLFFPVAVTGPALRQIAEARRICQGCRARTPCLDWALDHGVAAGIWGGATEDERHAMRRTLISDRSET
jgi:WhiB family redox-sensing transcriptional regulator